MLYLLHIAGGPAHYIALTPFGKVADWEGNNPAENLSAEISYHRGPDLGHNNRREVPKQIAEKYGYDEDSANKLQRTRLARLFNYSHKVVVEEGLEIVDADGEFRELLNCLYFFRINLVENNVEQRNDNREIDKTEKYLQNCE